MIIKNYRYQEHGGFITIQPQQKKDIRIIFDDSHYGKVQKYSEFIVPACWYKLTERPRTILEILNSIRKW